MTEKENKNFVEMNIPSQVKSVFLHYPLVGESIVIGQKIHIIYEYQLFRLGYVLPIETYRQGS